jgi:hypothetical protein
MTYDGKLRDRVGPGETLSSDGAMDGTMTVTCNRAAGNRNCDEVGATAKFRRHLGYSVWWLLGLGSRWITRRAAVQPVSNSAVNFAVTDGTSFKLFAGDDANGSYLPAGATATLTANFADGTTATASVVIPSLPPHRHRRRPDSVDDLRR